MDFYYYNYWLYWWFLSKIHITTRNLCVFLYFSYRPNKIETWNLYIYIHIYWLIWQGTPLITELIKSNRKAFFFFSWEWAIFVDISGGNQTVIFFSNTLIFYLRCLHLTYRLKHEFWAFDIDITIVLINLLIHINWLDNIVKFLFITILTLVNI